MPSAFFRLSVFDFHPTVLEMSLPLNCDSLSIILIGRFCSPILVGGTAQIQSALLYSVLFPMNSSTRVAS